MKQQTAEKHLFNYKKIVYLLLVLAFTAQIGTAQQKKSPGKKVLSTQAGDASVRLQTGASSLFDGKLNYALPLFSMQSRGATSFTPTLNLKAEWAGEISVSDYDGEVTKTLHYEGTNSPDYQSYNSPIVGYGPGSVLFRREAYTYRGDPGSGRTRIFFKEPNGGQVELRDFIYQGEAKASSINTAGVSRGQHFGSVDGSSTTFVSDSSVRDKSYCPDPRRPYCGNYESFPNGYLKFSNGVDYRVDNGKISWARDKNGNIMSFTYYDPNSIQGGQIKDAIDSYGRTIHFEYKVAESGTSEVFDKITYSGFGGQPRVVKVGWLPLSQVLRNGEVMPRYGEDLFPSFGCQRNCSAEVDLRDFLVVSSVVRPNQVKDSFKYNKYGEVARVEAASGSAVEYDYSAGDGTEGGDGYGETYNGSPFVYRRVSEQRTYQEGNLLNSKQTYEFSVNAYSRVNATTDTTVRTFDGQNGRKLSVQKHYFYGAAIAQHQSPDDFQLWREGKEYKTELLAANDERPLTRTETDWVQRDYPAWWVRQCQQYQTPNYPCNIEASPQVDPRVVETRNIDVESNLVTKKRFAYDEFNNQTDEWMYDLGQGQAGGLLTHSHTDYLRDGGYINNYSGAVLRRLPISAWVSPDESGTQKSSLRTYEYDNYSSGNGTSGLLARSNVTGHDESFNENRVKRGNITKITSYTNAQNQTGAISTFSQYDMLGNIIEIRDDSKVTSTLDYADNFGLPDAEARTNSAPDGLNKGNAFGFVTSETTAKGWKSYIQYDFYTGNVVDLEDSNGNVNSNYYNDAEDRMTQTVYASNRSNFKSQQTTFYDDARRRVLTTADLNTYGDNLIKGESFANSLGQTVESRAYEANGNYTITSKPEYDALGRVTKACNPYRPYLNEQLQCTTTTFDDSGRPTKIVAPDNSEVNTAFYGNTTTVVDQAGKKLRSVVDGLGRTIRVDESNDLSELGDVANPVQSTKYFYNFNGQMNKVVQGQQERDFLYDSLGRLIRIRQPEQNINPALNLPDPASGNSQWSTKIDYDNNGNVVSTTDANGSTVSATFDVLSRVLSRTYGDGTPAVAYEYDNPTFQNSRGRLTKVSSSVSATEYTNFDALGRVLSHNQTTDGRTFNTSYKYNLSGALVEETYPSGRVVKNNYNNDGKLSEVLSKKNSQNNFNYYASNFSYGTSGIATGFKMGNGKWENVQFNSRLQVTQIGLGNSENDSDLWKVNYEYGSLDDSGNVNTKKNDGNIVRQSTTFAGLASPFVQTFKYDPLNRLVEAKETQASQVNWKQSWSYDRFGNRTSFNQTFGQNSVNINTPQIDGQSNRFTSGQGFSYDSDGNIVKDDQNRSFTYDGDNKQILVKDANNAVVGEYKYDGSEHRVKKITATETTIFVYNVAGKLVAEYSTATSTNPTISYISKDALGSPRVITDGNGQVISRRDFMPFGEDLNVGVGQRINAQKYNVADGIRQGFTGYEKDQETNLSYAKARYYNNQVGRFTAVDPMLTSGRSSNPQTFNRYVYVSNNPITSVDPSGKCCTKQDVKQIVIDVIGGNAFHNDKFNVDAKLPAAKLNRLVNQITPILYKQYLLAYSARIALNSEYNNRKQQQTTTSKQTTTPSNTTETNVGGSVGLNGKVAGNLSSTGDGLLNSGSVSGEGSAEGKADASRKTNISTKSIVENITRNARAATAGEKKNEEADKHRGTARTDIGNLLDGNRLIPAGEIPRGIYLVSSNGDGVAGGFLDRVLKEATTAANQTVVRESDEQSQGSANGGASNQAVAEANNDDDDFGSGIAEVQSYDDEMEAANNYIAGITDFDPG